MTTLVAKTTVKVKEVIEMIHQLSDGQSSKSEFISYHKVLKCYRYELFNTIVLACRNCPLDLEYFVLHRLKFSIK